MPGWPITCSSARARWLTCPRWTSQLAAAGVDDLVLGVLPGNTAAIRLYQRYGFQPTWSYLSRFTGR